MRRRFRPGLCLLIIAAASIAAGCGRLDLRGPGYNDNVSKSMRQLRPPADESKLTGVDERSRDVERNLGVR